MASIKQWAKRHLKLGIPLLMTVTMLALSASTIAYAETDPGGTEVRWKIIYTDEATHSKQLMDTESGICNAGDTISVGFPKTITDEDGNIWTTDESPGDRTITGPGTEIIYIEYVKTGELPQPDDPYAEAEELLGGWINKAKEAEATMTRKSVDQIPTSSIICETEGKARLRLISAAAAIDDTSYHEVYLIAKGIVPTGIVLKECFGTEIVYSNDRKATIEIDGDEYTVHRFVMTKGYKDAGCHHMYEITSNKEATCIDKGVTKYKCTLCGDEIITYHAAKGHRDPDGDEICNVCGKSVHTSKPSNWRIGDLVTEYVGDEEYTFRCIDEDYSDYKGNKTGSALFLCESVIPAGLGAGYKDVVDATGHIQKVWTPGPIAYFGDNNNYKYSKIKAFLDGTEVFTAANSLIGVNNSYTGATAKDKFSQLTDSGLKTYSIGYQQMTAQLFILSVDEALRYKNYLWKFGDTQVDNPETITDSTSNAYWLRNPSGTTSDYNTSGMIYVVDLINGNIHTENIKPAGGSGDPYIDTQTTVGIRPAFTLPNSN